MADGEPPSVLAHVGANLRRLRQRAELSQIELAEASGVSRRTIINLEAGEANIGLSGLDHLAAALGVGFVDLVTGPERSTSSVNEVLWRGQDRASVAALLGSAPASHQVEMWNWSLAPGERYDASPDPPGWHELVYVVEGRLRLERDKDGAEDLGPGGHAVYSAAQRYAYANPGDVLVRFVRIVSH